LLVEVAELRCAGVQPRPLNLKSVRRVTRPSRRTFERLARAGEPLVIEGALAHWPAIGRWSPEDLRTRIGALRVKTYVIPRGQVLLDQKTGFRFEEMSVADYVEHVLSGESPSYYLRAPLEVFPQALRDELGVPEYCQGAVRLKRNVWFSAPGTVSRLHFDLPHNLIAQVHGRKEFVLYPFRERPNLYPFSVLSSTPHLSHADLEAPDLRAFPRLAEARGWRCELGEGDLLFMPSRTWHHAVSLGASITVNFWWPPLAILPLSLLSDGYKRVRGLNI